MTEAHRTEDQYSCFLHGDHEKPECPKCHPDARQRALADLLDSVDGVLAYDWGDSDSDAVEAIERMRKAASDYGTVSRFTT